MRLSDLPRTPRFLEQVLCRLEAWTHGRLPQWARRRVETGDLIQEATLAALEGLPVEDIRKPHVLEAYVRRSIRNRIVDEIRRAKLGEVAGDERIRSVADSSPGPLENAMESEDRRRFRKALLELSEEDQLLVVGRIEHGLDYITLTAVSGRASIAATRVAVRRAVLKIARRVGEDAVQRSGSPRASEGLKLEAEPTD